MSVHVRCPGTSSAALESSLCTPPHPTPLRVCLAQSMFSSLTHSTCHPPHVLLAAMRTQGATSRAHPERDRERQGTPAIHSFTSALWRTCTLALSSSTPLRVCLAQSMFSSLTHSTCHPPHVLLAAMRTQGATSRAHPERDRERQGTPAIHSFTSALWRTCTLALSSSTPKLSSWSLCLNQCLSCPPPVLQKFRAEHGSKKIGEVTVEQAYGGMRGIKGTLVS